MTSKNTRIKHDGYRWHRRIFARWFVRRCKKIWVDEGDMWPYKIVSKFPPKMASKLRQAM